MHRIRHRYDVRPQVSPTVANRPPAPPRLGLDRWLHQVSTLQMPEGRGRKSASDRTEDGRVAQGSARGEMTAGAVDSTAGMNRGAAEVEAGDEGPWAAQADRRAEDELLVKLHGAAAERTETERGVPRLQC